MKPDAFKTPAGAHSQLQGVGVNREGDLAALVSPELAEALETAHRTLAALPNLGTDSVSVKIGKTYSGQWVIRATVFDSGGHSAAEGNSFAEVVHKLTQKLTDKDAARQERIAKVKAEAEELGFKVREVRR